MGNKSNSAVKAGIGYTIGNYFIKGLTFLTIPIFSRLLSAADYGIYNSFVAYEAIAFVIIGMVFHNSYKKARYEFAEKYDGYVSSTLLIILINSIIGIVLINIFGDFIGGALGLDRISLNMLILYSFATAIITCYNAYLGIEYQYKSFVVIAFLNAVGNIGLSILLIVTIFEDRRYMGRIIGTIIPGVLISVYIIYKLWKKKKPENIVQNTKWGMKYCIPLIPHGISQVLLTQFDRIMIRKIVGDVEAGIYSFAYNIFTIVNVTTTSLSAVWEPWFFERVNAKDYHGIRRVSSLYAVGMLVFSAIVMLLAPEIIFVLGTPEYYDAVYTVVPIVAGGYFAFLYTIPSMVEYFYSKTQFVAIGTVGAAVLNVILNLICIQKFGYVAAAYTTLISYMVYFIFHYILAWKIQGGSLFNTKIIMLCCVVILGLNFLSIGLIDYMLIRWLLAVALGVLAIVIEEKQIGFIKKKLNK